MSNEQPPTVAGPAADHSLTGLSAEEAAHAAEIVNAYRQARAVVAEYDSLPSSGPTAGLVRGAWVTRNGQRLTHARAVLRGGK